MKWSRASDTAIRSGNFTIAKCVVEGEARYALHLGPEFIGAFDTHDEARVAAAVRDGEEMAGAA